MKEILVAVCVVLMSAICVHAGAKDLLSKEAKGIMDRNRNIYLLDVRTQQEFQQGRISGAVLIPISEFERRVGEVPKNRPVMVYCAVGSRSRPAADFLARKGYREVYHMSDGIVGWYRNGFPVQRGR